MGIPLSRFLREFTSADIAELRALALLESQEREAPPVATPEATPASKEASFRALMGHRVVVKKKG